MTLAIQHIFKTNGTYLGFIQNGFIFSRDGKYLGWIESQFAWDGAGKFRGTLMTVMGHEYILLNKLGIVPLPKTPRISNDNPMLPPPPPNIPAIALLLGWADAF